LAAANGDVAVVDVATLLPAELLLPAPGTSAAAGVAARAAGIPLGGTAASAAGAAAGAATSMAARVWGAGTMPVFTVPVTAGERAADLADLEATTAALGELVARTERETAALLRRRGGAGVTIAAGQ
jgi:hypothetical protein